MGCADSLPREGAPAGRDYEGPGFVQSRCLPTPPSPSFTSVVFPRPLSPSAILSPLPARAAAEVMGLALHTTAVHGAWHRVYSSAEDGLSFNRLSHAIKGYGGPTVTVIQDDSGAVRDRQSIA